MDGGGVLGAVVCMLLVFAIFPLLLWRRRSDDSAGDNHRLPPQPLQADRVVHRGAAPRRMRRRPAAAASTSRDGNAQAETPGFLLPFLDCILTLTLGCADAEDDGDSDEEEVEEAYNARKASKKERKRQEREEQRQVGYKL
jgi:DDRGK domain-containing protein 1